MTPFASGAPWHWYALRVKANREWMVTDALRLRGLPAYLPLHRVRTQWSDRVSFALRPLFVGYVFAFLTAEETPSILDLPGVVHLLPTSLHPAIVPFEQIELVERLILSKCLLREAEHVPGETVTISAGPLKGVSGVVVRVNNTARLVVDIQMMGRSVSVELDAESLAACRN